MCVIFIQKVVKWCISYKTSLNSQEDYSDAVNIFNCSDYSRLPEYAYTGTVAFDLSSMSPYIINSNALWKIQLDGIDEATLNIIDSYGKNIYTGGSGTQWYKQSHVHEYDEGIDITYDSATGTWSRIDTCSICGYQNKVIGDCSHNYVSGDVIYRSSTWTEYEKCSICGHQQAVKSGTCFYNLDFESNVDSWGTNGMSAISYETDDTGNKYMKIEYTGAKDSSPNYYEVFTPSNWLYSSKWLSGKIEMSFDVMFEGNDGDIYLKRRAEGINQIVLRVCSKETGRLQYGSNNGRRTFYGSNGGYVNSVGKWLHVRIVANISDNENTAVQSIYITDKNTGEKITSAENVALVNNVANSNLIMIGGSSTVNIDNIIIRDVK